MTVGGLTWWIVYNHYPPEDTLIGLLSQRLKVPHRTADETRLPLGHSPLHQSQLLPNICRTQKCVQLSPMYLYIILWSSF